MGSNENVKMDQNNEDRMEGNGNDDNSNPDDDRNEAVSFRKLFIGGLDYKTTEETLKRHFEKWGKIVDVVVMKDPITKRSRGFGFITYSRAFMVDDCQAARPHKVDGREVEPKRAVPREDMGYPEASLTVRKLFVGGLSDDLEESDLRKYFSDFGKVTSIHVMVAKETGKKRGFAFVEFADHDAVDKVVLSKNHVIGGRRVNVRKALSRADMVSLQQTGRIPGVGGRERERENRGPMYGRDRDMSSPRDRDFGPRDRERDFGGPRDRDYGMRDREFGGGPRDRDFGGPRERERDFGGVRDREYMSRDRDFGPRDRDYSGPRDRDYGGPRERDRDFSGPRDRDFGGPRERDRDFERGPSNRDMGPAGRFGGNYGGGRDGPYRGDSFRDGGREEGFRGPGSDGFRGDSFGGGGDSFRSGADSFSRGGDSFTRGGDSFRGEGFRGGMDGDWGEGGRGGGPAGGGGGGGGGGSSWRGQFFISETMPS
ncbi:heterogeneous nuclear ribonucleoprotein A1, A2/B1 homolog [Hetaerina americana]|uniref:heterogeneous nuclear ribonucleoprotein A1, A2/B1 homolog n=1 Tax=Hetaerina americana TaxID=62018 RepID=UPI003A7F4861